MRHNLTEPEKAEVALTVRGMLTDNPAAIINVQSVAKLTGLERADIVGLFSKWYRDREFTIDGPYTVFFGERYDRRGTRA